MPYDTSRDTSLQTRKMRPAGAPSADPAGVAVALTAAMVSDTADLAVYAKSLRVWNGTGGVIVLMVTAIREPSDEAAAAVPLHVPAGACGTEFLGVRRVWSTGSTGLAAALTAGTATILLLMD